MDEKISNLDKKVTDLDKKVSKLDDKVTNLEEKVSDLDKKIDLKIAELDKKIDSKIEESEKRIIEQCNISIKSAIEESEKRILDHYFLFEAEYGKKIDAILDILSINRDKYYENSEEITYLSTKVNQNKTKIFGLEERVSILEAKS